VTERTETAESADASSAGEYEDEAHYAYETPGEEVPAPVPQVPAYIAIIRIIAVLGMGLSISFGLFIMLIGLKGVIIGIPIVLLSVPCYYGMQLAERMVARHEASEVAADQR
jgi:hypothetical protein